MKTIEEQIEEFARKLTPCAICNENSDGVGCKVEIKDCAWRKDIYKAFAEIAKLQREIDEEVRLKKSDEMTKEEFDREVAFADWYNKNGKGVPTYSDAIEWARKDLLDKVCEWIDKYLHLFVMKGNILYPKLAQEFRKAMEE